ncbi:hypothetical protein C8J30_10314 [Rhodobacter viridis]|uniref:Uncharacterized protein n=1 Tax=Rhodobacter viridis TaxID=1054202 RepID=A0A318TZQ2_9RHOB|nr:hypothetical protein [Rhodobacter viridis]PYF10921.1 hypothetical protein C8J30_10314 [Rhodobacter viridis]
MRPPWAGRAQAECLKHSAVTGPMCRVTSAMASVMADRAYAENT